MRGVNALDPTGFGHAAHQLGQGGLFGQNDIGQLAHAQRFFARQAGHDAPLHQGEAIGLDHGMKLARNQMTSPRQQVSQVVINKACITDSATPELVMRTGDIPKRAARREKGSQEKSA